MWAKFRDSLKNGLNSGILIFFPAPVDEICCKGFRAASAQLRVMGCCSVPQQEGEQSQPAPIAGQVGPCDFGRFAHRCTCTGAGPASPRPANHTQRGNGQRPRRSTSNNRAHSLHPRLIDSSRSVRPPCSPARSSKAPVQDSGRSVSMASAVDTASAEVSTEKEVTSSFLVLRLPDRCCPRSFLAGTPASYRSRLRGRAGYSSIGRP